MQRKQRHFRNAILTAFSSWLMLTGAHATKPLWTFVPQSPTKITVAKGGSEQVIYDVQNQSSRAKTLVMKPIAGVSQSAPCQLAPKGNCRLTLNVSGSVLQGDVLGGPVLCHQGNDFQCYQPSSANILRIHLLDQPPVQHQTTLSLSTNELVLSVTGLTEYGINDGMGGTQASGVSRIITVTNTGAVDATNLSVIFPDWPSGTTSSTTCGNALAAGDVCTITVTPGNIATSNGTNPCSSTGTAPVADSIIVTADNASAASTDVLVLNYGCIYQGGYVFAFDDTTAEDENVGGKVAALLNQAPPLPNGINWSPTNDIVGVSESSTVPCSGAIDGACDTDEITTFYSASNPNIYAAGLCKATIDGFSDWYLPAICEMGFDTNNEGTGCGIQSSPTLQNMQLSLTENGNIGGLFNSTMWSATEYGLFVTPLYAWVQFFHTTVSNQVGSTKTQDAGVRCVRALTY